MRKLLLVSLVAMMALAGCGEIMDSYYPTSKEAVSDGAIKRGWVPGFLATGASEIREAHDLDTNGVIVACKMSDPELSALLARSQKIEKMGDFAPALSLNRHWWPKAFREGNYEQLSNEGFWFLSMKDDQRTWFAAVNSTSGQVYLWQ